MIVQPETVHDAMMFAAAAIVIVLISLPFPAERRRGLLGSAVVAVAGVGLLYLHAEYQGTMGSETITSVVREALLAIIAFAVIRVFMIFVLQTLLARLELPRILSECLLGLALVAYVLIRLSAVGVNLAGVVTTSAVLSAALAFSAQETLGNLWAGISLQLENTVRLGDWIRIDSTVGQVVSIRWRSMAIATYTNETIVVPNSLLMKNKVEVIARRADERIPWRRNVTFEVDYDLPPARVCAVVSEALKRAEIPNALRTPPPECLCKAFMDSGAQYSVVYQVIDPRLDWNTKSEVLAHVYSALARADMPIPFPRRVVELREDTRSDRQRRELIDKRAILDEVELFTSLTSEERDALARKLDAALYATDDIVCRQGEPADSLFILARGQVHIVGEAPPGVTRPRFATLQAPAYFGEMGLLLGAPRGATVLASGDVLCYCLDKRGFDATLKARPELAVALSEVLAKRQAANQATLQAFDSAQRGKPHASAAAEMVRKIRDFFGLAGGGAGGTK
jgi:small-conductance mechanosensitive channel/CRP-like cAMP-binding protein